MNTDIGVSALIQSEERFRDLVEGSVLPIQIMSRESERLYVNQAFLDLLGYATKEEIYAMRSPAQFVAPHHWELLSRIRTARERGEPAPLSYDFDMCRKDGAIIPVQVVIRPIVWDGVSAHQRTYIDLTERKKAGEALQESEARYRNLIERSILAMQIISDDGKRLYVNQAFLDLYGFETKEQVYSQQHIGVFTAPHERERIDQFCRGQRDLRGGPTSTEFDARKNDGSIFPVQMFARPILWEREPAQQRIYIDLTERKVAEKALQESEARYRVVTEASPDAMVVTDKDRTIMFVNSAAVDLYGAESKDQLIGLDLIELVHPKDREAVEKRRQLALQGWTPPFVERTRLRLDGSEFASESHGVPVTWDGKRAILIVVRDITKRKQAEAQLHQAQKMEAIGQLTGGVAHDFNNLLTVVIGNLKLIFDRSQDEDLRALTQKSLKAAQHGTELTQQLLSYARQQSLAPKVIDINEQITATIDLLCNTMGETIKIKMAPGDDLWKCLADPAQLETAILNLAINARDAMPNGGTIAIETSNFTIGDDDEAIKDDLVAGDYIKVMISDTGIGMTCAVADRAIEPFFTTKDVGEGSGLGLSMVYGFIKQSGGHMAIESKEGDGTTMTLYLPRSLETDEPVQQISDAQASVSQGERILVVEDDPNVRELTVYMLEDIGYDVVEAADGKEAIEVLKNTPTIDLLFTDVSLPGGMSGPDIANEAIRHVPGIKVLYVSGYANNKYSQLSQLGADVPFIKKPIWNDNLAKKVRAALDWAER